MDVFLVPAGPDGHELYCEPHHDAAPIPGERPGWRARLSWSFWRARVTRTFRIVLTYLEQERERRAARRAARHRGTLLQRVRDRVVAWMAERVAEQRLLWRLRSAGAAVAHYPDDLSAEEASAIVRRSLQRDGARHRNWLLFDATGCAVTAPLSFVPGPNILLYFFIFRATGHYLSWTGARHGTSVVRWTCQPCPPLTELRRLTSMPLTERAALASAVASRLGLEHIDTFAERMALVRP
jgi:hypothetical protein